MYWTLGMLTSNTTAFPQIGRPLTEAWQSFVNPSTRTFLAWCSDISINLGTPMDLDHFYLLLHDLASFTLWHCFPDYSALNSHFTDFVWIFCSYLIHSLTTQIHWLEWSELMTFILIILVPKILIIWCQVYITLITCQLEWCALLKLFILQYYQKKLRYWAKELGNSIILYRLYRVLQK